MNLDERITAIERAQGVGDFEQAAHELELAHQEIDARLTQQEVVDARMREARGQLTELSDALDVPKDRYLHLPYAPVDKIVGGLRPGSLWIPCAFSGDGKSSFIFSCIERWLHQGMRIALMPLETKPWKVRVHLACRQLGVDPGDVITGKILEHPEGAAIRQQVKDRANEFLTPDWTGRLKIFPHTFIGHKQLEEVAKEVVDMEADVWIIDHIDQIQGGDGNNAFGESKRVLETLFELKQSLDLTIVALSQLNNDAVRGDPLGRYRAATPNMVYMGGTKRMVSDGMLSIYRPMKVLPKGSLPDDFKAWRERLKDARSGAIPAKDLLIPNTMAVTCMKHREYGAREGDTCYLGIGHGKVRELEFNEAAARGLLNEAY